MSSSQPIPSIACTVGLPVACLLIGRNHVPYTFLFFWQTRLRGGLSGAKIPGRRASWRRTFGILSSPDPDGLPSTCDALPDECSLLCKGHLFARAKLPMCECREPSGNPSGSGVCKQPDNPPQLVVERGFTRNHYPSPMWGGNKGVPNKTRVR
jgi:hypothetical protein